MFKSMIVLGACLLSAWNVSAWNPPGLGSHRNIPAELINIGCKYSANGSCYNRQGKYGPFITESFLKAGNDIAWSMPGTIVAENYIASIPAADLSGKGDSFQLHPVSLLDSGNGFFKKIFAPGVQGQLVFGTRRAGPQNSEIAPVVGNLSQSSPENGVQLLADSQFCNTQTMITTSTPAIQFWNSVGGANADISARGIQLSGGSPQPGMVLVSTDTEGNAVWATPVLNTDGSISFTHTVSPVVAGQASCN